MKKELFHNFYHFIWIGIEKLWTILNVIMNFNNINLKTFLWALKLPHKLQTLFWLAATNHKMLENDFTHLSLWNIRFIVIENKCLCSAVVFEQ